MIDKCRTMMVSKKLYNMGSPHKEGDGEKEEENTVTI